HRLAKASKHYRMPAWRPRLRRPPRSLSGSSTATSIPSVMPARSASTSPSRGARATTGSTSTRSSSTPASTRHLATRRGDATPPGGGVPGADPAFVERQLLQEAGVDFANLIVLQPKIKQVNPEFESALFAGHNAWLDATWLGKHNWHGRYRGSLRVSP